uniref:Protein misato homolog 1 n=1 Tax=Melopsittacus undulatus TaxID=13146 RepID=A0A8V5GD68_MELUD
MPAEAVTLQLGPYAGSTGAHWWGLQAAALRRPAEAAELRSSALLRPAHAPGGREVHVPRLVALQLKGTGGRGRRGGARAASQEPLHHPAVHARWVRPGGLGSLTWDGGFILPARNEEGNRISSILVPLFHRDCGCLEAFAQGEGLLQDPACMEELEDRLHYFTEECDSLQGFQVLCDLHNGFSGVGAKVTELLRDEYSGKGILSWGLTPALSSGDSHRNAYRLMNTALGIIHLSTHSSLFCPMSLGGSLGLKPQPPVTFPYLSYDASLSSHSSAILAAALDTLTVPYRLSCSQGSILHLAETLNFSGRKVAAAWASVPFPALHGSSLPDALCTHQDVPWKLLASCRERRGSSCFAQSVVLRGLGKDRASLGSEQGALNWELQGVWDNFIPLPPYSTSHVLEQPCYTPAPYPQFFSPLKQNRERTGLVALLTQSFVPAAVESIPVLAALRSAPVLHTLLYGLYKDLQQLNPRRCASFFSAGLEQEDFQEALHRLRTLSQCYETELEAEESDDEADSD